MEGARHNPKRAIRQRPLQRRRFRRGRRHPNRNFFRSGEDDWHCFGMNRANLCIRLRRQERIEVVRRLAFLHFARYQFSLTRIWRSKLSDLSTKAV
jgi:hypothetical protein